jgi:hypothetical protein
MSGQGAAPLSLHLRRSRLSGHPRERHVATETASAHGRLGPLLWLTDLAEPPTPESVGLTSQNLKCDRLAKRITVNSKAVAPWSAVREKAPKEVVGWLESLGQPDHWWVARRPLTRSEFTLP